MKRILTILAATFVVNSALAQVACTGNVCIIAAPVILPTKSDVPNMESPLIDVPLPVAVPYVPNMESPLIDVPLSVAAPYAPAAHAPEVPTLNIYHVEGGIRDGHYATAIHQLTPPTIGNAGVASTFCDVVNCGDAAALQ